MITSYKCDREGCTNQAAFCPEIEINNAKGQRVGNAVVGLRICGDCALKTKLGDVITDATWAGFLGRFSRDQRRTVSRKRSTLGIVPLDHPGARVSLERRDRLEAEQAKRAAEETPEG